MSNPASTSVSTIADSYVRALAAHEPAAAQALGRTDGPDLPDLGVDWHLERLELERAVLEQLAAATATTDGERILRAALVERLESNRALFETGYTTRMIAGLATPIHLIRESVEGIPVTADAVGAAVIRRLERAPFAIGQYADTLRWSRAQGAAGRFTGSGVAPARQITELAGQLRRWVTSDTFGTLQQGETLGDDDRRRLRSAADAVNAALETFTTFLLDDLLPTAPVVDAVGSDTYGTIAASMLGSTLDLEQIYAYGWSELERLTAEARAIATTLGGTGDDPVRTAAELLDGDPRYRLEGIDAIEGWLTRRVEESIVALQGTAFDLPATIRDVDALVSQASTGVVYYTPGPPDGSANSRIVWTIPSGVPVAASWQEVTSVHHEGLPGHHLEHTINRANTGLHPWQRYLCEIHGYAEGWAHYAEGLADELGLVRDPAERLGMLLGQIWRSVRIVADIGMHTGWAIPQNTMTSAAAWTPELARDLLVDLAMVEPELARFEVDRYLGIPGQALAFKVGAKLWLDAREAVREQRGTEFTLARFHERALSFGPMGLGPLRELLLAP